MKRIMITLLIILMLIHKPIETESGEHKLTLKQINLDVIYIQKIILKSRIDNKLDNFYLELKNKHSQKYVVNFIDELTCKAIDSEALPSIIIAQAALETGYGKYNKLGNNIFGIKGRGIKTKTKEWYNDRFVTIYDHFQYFPTVDAAIKRHFEIINRYNFETRDYIEWATKIKLGGYATDPNYSKKIIYIVNKFNLTELDKVQELKLKYEKI